jgi:hypothetical protein
MICQSSTARSNAVRSASTPLVPGRMVVDSSGRTFHAPWVVSAHCETGSHTMSRYSIGGSSTITSAS